MTHVYDFIVIGAGSAGCIIASRLSENGQYRVLLLEAGGHDQRFWLKIPIGFAKSYYNPRVNWMYSTAPQTELYNRSLYCPRGKVQGGSGTINAMIYVRGHPQDFDSWAQETNDPQWNYQSVLPYFQRLEQHPQRGGNGAIEIYPMHNDIHPLCNHFLQACDTLSLPRTQDFNGTQMEGAGIYEINTSKGQRCSSSIAYLQPALARKQLEIWHHTNAQRLIFDAHSTRVIGVEVYRNQQHIKVMAKREVIVSAGAINSPVLLEHSGLGQSARLQQYGIPMIKELPAVGEYLQDHLCASYYYQATVPTLNDQFSHPWYQLKYGLQYLLQGKGPFTLSVNQAGGFFKGLSTLTYPNLQFYFNPLSYQIHREHQQLNIEPYSGFLLCFNAMRPTSRGSVHIKSIDPMDHPHIDPQYLTTDHDQQEVIQGSRMLRNLMNTPALRRITKKEVLPNFLTDNDTKILDYFRQHASSIYHLCGSCRMGINISNSVVDSHLRVHGVAGLRIADASVFPTIPSGNINAPVMMLAEKAAELILNSHSSISSKQTST